MTDVIEVNTPAASVVEVATGPQGPPGVLDSSTVGTAIGEYLTANPVTKASVGLGNADNTADSAKPVSTAQQAALDGKSATGHGHAQSDVTGLTAALSGKAATSHSHVIADTTGLQTALDGKQASGSYAAATHTHAQSDVTGLSTALSGKSDTGHTHAYADITGKPSTFTPSTHNHPVTDITATGTASSSTYLRGDGSWATPAGGSTAQSIPALSSEPAGSAPLLWVQDLGSGNYQLMIKTA